MKKCTHDNSKESVQNSLLQMQDKKRGAQTRRVYENTRGREHRSDEVLHCSSRVRGRLLESRWLGRTTYDEGLEHQEKLIAKKLAGAPNNDLLLLEHEPVYTIGRTQDQTSLGNKELPHPLHRIGRGGQATYHGPGQLVAYPIIDLTLMGKDLHRYLRLLEEVIIKTLALYDIAGERREGMTGVWIGPRKIASLGIGVRKWISMHGLALNVCGDLSPFEEITPCGLTGVKMTSIEKELKKTSQPTDSLSVESVGEELSHIFKSLL